MEEKNECNASRKAGETGPTMAKNSIESLSKEEIINKYVGLLQIAKKAKQAKDEMVEENRKLKEALSHSETQKEADKQALLTMKEMLEEFTQQKLQMTTQLNEEQSNGKNVAEAMMQLSIENESLKRQLKRLTEDNESLLMDIDHMEHQLQQVTLLGKEQKQHLEMLELEVLKLKETDSLNASLQSQITVTQAENKALKEEANESVKRLEQLSQKYKQAKTSQSEQRQKLQTLKERFIEVHRKLKNLKECKRILLETQHEYADAVTKWQNEIINASRQLMAHMNALKIANEDLTQQLQDYKQFNVAGEDNKETIRKLEGLSVETLALKLSELQTLSENACRQYEEQGLMLQEAQLKHNTEINEEEKAVAFTEVQLEQQKLELQDVNKLQESEVRRQEDELAETLQGSSLYINTLITKLNGLYELCEKASDLYKEKQAQLEQEQQQNSKLQIDLDKAIKNSEDVVDMHQLTEQQKLECKRLTQELQDLKIKLKENDANLATLRNENDHFKIQLAEHENQQEQYVKLTKELEEYKLKLENEQQLQREMHESADQNASMQVELLKQKQIIQEQQISDLNAKLSKAAELRDELEHVRVLLKTMEQEKIALLGQLKEQQAQEQQQNADEIALNELRHSNEELLLRYEQKEREHADLLGEMRELNEALKARGDVISRQQEKQQELIGELKKQTTKLKQTEDKLGEREHDINQRNKLMSEITREVQEARQRVQELEETCTRNEEQVRALNEELLSLRAADAQSDVLSTSTISRADEANRLREVDESFEEKYNKLRGLAVKLKKKLQEQTAYINEMDKQQSASGTLKKEVEEWKKKHNEMQTTLEQNQKHLETLKSENQKLKSSRKQANVLNLEIEAAEKTLCEATAKLSAKTEELETLNAVLSSKDATIVQLRKEIDILEAAKEAEFTHSKELKEQIDHLQTQIKDAVHSKQNTLVASKELEQTHESVKRELEELRLQHAGIASKHEAALSAVQAEKQQQAEKLQATQEQLKTELAKNKVSERSYEDLRVEYLEYKVKAQAVLRKNQTKDSCKDRELEEELLALRATEKQLQTSVEMHVKQLAECEQQIELLKEDNESLQRRCKELHGVVEELRQQNEHLAQENRSQVLSQQETLKKQRQQIEQLDTCHKEQMKQLEVAQQKQLDQLKAEQSKAIRLPPIIGATTTTLATPAALSSEQQSKIDFLLMEREAAEGSEEAEAIAANVNASAIRKISTASSTTRQRSQHDFMPLDELLTVPMNAISDTVTTITATSLGRQTSASASNHNDSFENMHVELQSTKERLQIQESRERHLTALLAENEQDLAKLTQMNDMLKEELRRQERAVEREQHMHNSEYLKNVILKFLTLHNGDERTRLVPVVSTILKLSRSEMDMLNCVAKGQKVSTDTTARGWSNFLPSWGNNNNNN